MPSRRAIKLGNAGVAIWICHGLTCLPVQNMIIRIEVPDQWKLRNQKPWQAFVLRKEPDHDAGKQNGAGHGRRVWHWRGLRYRFGGGGSQCCRTEEHTSELQSRM